MMKLFERYEEESTTESFAVILNNEKGNVDFIQKMKNKGEGDPCDRCGYTDCVCPRDEAQELSQKKEF